MRRILLPFVLGSLSASLGWAMRSLSTESVVDLSWQLENRGTATPVGPHVLATCAHCLPPETDLSNLTLVKDGESMPARIAMIDRFADLALLVVDREIPFYYVADRIPAIGDRVVSIGWVGGADQLMIADGRITGPNTSSAFALPGCSGGPLLDEHGRLVGLQARVMRTNTPLGDLYYVPQMSGFNPLTAEVLARLLAEAAPQLEQVSPR